MNIKVYGKYEYNLKALAALQFPGSIDNFGRENSLHILEEQLYSNAYVPLGNAINQGKDLTDAKFFDQNENSHKSISDVVLSLLCIEEDDVDDYNEENPDLPFVRYEDIFDKQRDEVLPERLNNVGNEGEYVNAYEPVTGVSSFGIDVCLMSDNYKTLGFAFTHQALKRYEDSIDYHSGDSIRHEVCGGEEYRRSGEDFVGDFDLLTRFLFDAGEQLLAADLQHYKVNQLSIVSNETVLEHYKNCPHKPIEVGCFKVVDRDTDTVYSYMFVYCSGHIEKSWNGTTHAVCDEHYVTVKKDDGDYTLPYPFAKDVTIDALRTTSSNDGERLSPAERLFCWTEYRSNISL